MRIWASIESIRRGIVYTSPPKCFRCGDCCLRIPVELTKEEIERIAKHLNPKERKIFYQNLTKNPLEANPIDGHLMPTLTKEAWLKAPCMFLTWTKDGKAKCKIYPIRPHMCRIFYCGRKSPDEPLNARKYIYEIEINPKKLKNFTLRDKK